MAMKSIAYADRAHIASIPKASDAKKFGQTVELRSNWEDIKIAMMYKVCYPKFLQNTDLKQLLLSTGDKYLEETNYWKDTTWGVCNRIGTNYLGKVLMAVREDIRLI